MYNTEIIKYHSPKKIEEKVELESHQNMTLCLKKNVFNTSLDWKIKMRIL